MDGMVGSKNVPTSETLAVIPARGGSKSIPRKNIKLFGGHPLIAYSIAAGLQAENVNRVIVSTDDEEIAEVARQYGAETPFLRPKELAQDDTQDLPVFEHALHWLNEHEGYQPRIVVQLRPTSPVRPRTCVDDAVAVLLNDPTADSVRAVTPSGQNPYKMWRIHNSDLLPLLQTEFSEPYNMPRQKLPDTFWQTGHIDVMRSETIIKKHSLTGDRIRPLMIDARYAIDIDNPEQWELGEWVLSHWNLDVVKPARESSFSGDVRLVVLDFDGVLTDDRVYVLEDGREAVACNRSDGMGIGLLKKQGVEVVVLSREANPVVSARCRKLNLPCYQGVEEKVPVFQALVSERGLTMDQVIYVGNDVNDLECMRLARWGVAVADAHAAVLQVADWVLSKPGGRGAVRELCDLIMSPVKEHSALSIQPSAKS